MNWYHCKPDNWDLNELLENAIKLKELCDFVFFNHNCVCSSRMPTYRSLKMLIAAIRRYQSAYCSFGEPKEFVCRKMALRFKNLRSKVWSARNLCYFTRDDLDML